MNVDTLIDKLSNHFKMKFYDDLDYVRTDEYEFMICLDEEKQQFSIYREFSFPVHSNMESNAEIMFFELLFIQSLYSTCALKPEMEYEFSMGCYYDDELVGFFNVDLDSEKIFEYVRWFIEAEKCEEDLNYDLLRDTFPEKLDFYISQWKAENKLEYWTNIGWQVYKSRNCDWLGTYITAIVNDRGSVVAGIEEEDYKEIISSMKIDECKPISPYWGLEYAIVRDGDSCFIWNMKLIKDVIAQIEKMGLYYEDDISYYLSNKETLIVRCANYWAIIMPCKAELDKIIMTERDKIKKMWNELQAISPDAYSEVIEDIDLSRISPSNFEELCKHILGELGFENILSRGNTNVADGGVDIECDEKVKRLLSANTKHWIFQCKHTKSQINRKDVAEVPSLLKEFNAEGYGLFYSGTFTPQTIDRLKMMSAERCDIHYWDEFMIVRTINKNNNLLRIYKSMIKNS